MRARSTSFSACTSDPGAIPSENEIPPREENDNAADYIHDYVKYVGAECCIRKEKVIIKATTITLSTGSGLLFILHAKRYSV